MNFLFKNFIITVVFAWLLIFSAKDTLAVTIGDGNANSISPVDSNDFKFIFSNWGQVLSMPNGQGADQFGDSKINTFDFKVTSAFLPKTPPENVIILCENKTFDGVDTPFKLNGGQAADPGHQKIIRNCVFKNSATRQIVLKNAQNVLIEGNTFQNIRTNVPGTGAHGISVSPDETGVVDNITVRNNTFTEIGADGIQIGEGTGSKTSNFTIESNTFVGNEDWGENAIDVKGALGPIIIRRNDISGFRECQSPPRGGNQDCSGSPGEGMVIHEAGSGSPDNVIIEENKVHDNIFGISISNLVAKSAIVRNNEIFDQQTGAGIGILIRNSSNVQANGNTFSNNKENCSGLSPCQ